uniref:Small ribosomal subunit protein bS18c n=1 Tax=Selaginella kraussiana TaxID=81964 RepID=A0A3T0IAT2_9TRAC|nr:ribosomal protein S18 [Selaginella kraussiana]AZU95798.1 ribosomal protein S18 [Selaginella kraussiana]
MGKPTSIYSGFYRGRPPLVGPGGTVGHKNLSLLRRFVSKRGGIMSKQMNGSTSKQQRSVTNAVKRARSLAPLTTANNEI